MSMVLPLALSMAIRFSRGRRGPRGSRMISLISLISTLGIALGVAVLIIALSAMNGFERELKNRILAVVPHGEITAVNQPFTDWRDSLRRVRQVTGVIAAAPFIHFTGLMEYGARLHAVQIRGVDPTLEPQLSALPQFVLNHAWSRFRHGQQQVILGKGIADSLGVKAGKWITVMLPSHSSQMKLLQPKRIRLQVSGILQLSGQLENTLALIPLDDARNYLAMQDSVSGIAIKVGDVFAADQLVRNAGEATNAHVHISSWITTYGYMYQDIQMIRSIVYLAMLLVIGVACFNIISTLLMTVKNKSSDIAVMRTLGARDGLIRAIFLWYGLLTGLAGSLTGVAAGVIASLQLTTALRYLEKLIGFQFLSADVYFIDFLPSELHWLDVVYVLLTALSLSLLASWYPARRACRIDPAQILSGQ